MRVKYIRVSTSEQNTDRQETFEGSIYKDVCSGSVAFKDRSEGYTLMYMAEDVTEILVHSIDRLGRNTLDIMQTIQYFTDKGVNIISEKEGLNTIVDGKENPIAKMMMVYLVHLLNLNLLESKRDKLKVYLKQRLEEAIWDVLRAVQNLLRCLYQRNLQRTY